MKFANYRFCARGVNNLGDNMQIIAVDFLYRQMGIDQDEIVYIDTQDLATYRGEYVVLPINLPLVDYREGGIAKRFSPYIIPVFFGLTMITEDLQPEEVAYYRKYEPIGCRDERTLNTLRKYHIQCYLHGCITVTLPQRESVPEDPKTFIVDVDTEFIKYIPQKLLQEAQYRTQLCREKLDDPKQEMLKLYQEYLQNAGLVITSLLHCAVPCMAAGIPVVMVREELSYRMAWLDKLLPIYTLDMVADINWTPLPVELAEHKNRVLEITKARLWDVYKKNEALCDLSWFYENRPKRDYVNDACSSLKDFIDTNWKDFQKEYLYSIWGITQISEWIIAYIKKNYPNARLCHVYDSYRKVNIHGLCSEDPEKIVQSPSETIFVTTNGAEEAARELFKKIGKQEGTFAFATYRQNRLIIGK